MDTRFVFKKTNEFTEEEGSQFLDLFGLTFPKHMTTSLFKRKYMHTPFGYSYHGLMLADGKVVGAYNLIPYMYRYFDKDVIFALSVDAMIHEHHRTRPFGFVKMANLALAALKQDGICFAFGFPNDNVYEFTKRVLKWRHIGEVDFYILPCKVGAVKPNLVCLNSISRACCSMLARFPLGRSRACHTYGIEKTKSERFDEHRYDGSYTRIDLGALGQCIYTTCEEENGVRALYIIDVAPLTPAAFDSAIGRIYAESTPGVDLFIYAGKLPFIPTKMIRLPKSMRPRQVHMCGRILDPETVDDRVFDMENWNINISNFDVR
jgi:hypothetical protein